MIPWYGSQIADRVKLRRQLEISYPADKQELEFW